MQEAWTPPDYRVDENGKIVGAVNARTPNNWGRWGPIDQMGTMNLITPDVIAHAATLIRTGRSVSCAVPLDNTGPVYPGRAGVFHAFTYAGSDYVAGAPIAHQLGSCHVTDDVLFMPLQGSTQWDGLAHVGTDNMLYNGFWVGTVAASSGARRCSIHHMKARMQGRGVLLDLVSHQNVERLMPGHAITVAELESCAKAEGLKFRAGDMLVIRTGHVPHFYTMPDKHAFFANGAPGLSITTADWMHAHDIAAVAMDNIAIEVEPFEQPCDHPFPLHGRLIRDLGMSLGEIWWLEDLAAACRDTGRYEFFLTAAPLNLTNAAGSPINPVAIF
jgi:kynurenine formamidase